MPWYDFERNSRKFTLKKLKENIPYYVSESIVEIDSATHTSEPQATFANISDTGISLITIAANGFGDTRGYRTYETTEQVRLPATKPASIRRVIFYRR